MKVPVRDPNALTTGNIWLVVGASSERVGGERSASVVEPVTNVLLAAGRRDLDQIVSEALEHEIAGDDQTAHGVVARRKRAAGVDSGRRHRPVTVPVPAERRTRVHRHPARARNRA